MKECLDCGVKISESQGVGNHRDRTQGHGGCRQHGVEKAVVPQEKMQF